MNKQVHRLVFDRRRGMRVPAAEHVRSAGKAAGGERRATALVSHGLLVTAAMVGPLVLGLAASDAQAQQRTMSGSVTRAAAALNNMASSVDRNLPKPYSGNLYVNQGKFSTNYDYGNKALNINQQDDKVIINWDSFNVGQGYTVRFVQPNSTSSALNNIWSQDPSVILGRIQANGEVILQNQNGFIFGATARVDTGRFVATALKLAKDTYTRGIRANALVDTPTFGDDTSAPTGFITIERGAEIRALAGGDVMMVAPKVYNEGTIETPKGQTILAAGQKVYLYNSADPAQRGLVVAVDAFADNSNDVNTVEQAVSKKYNPATGEVLPDNTTDLSAKVNQISAEQGTVNLVGMTIRQNGLLTATTAVKGQNGAIYLQAQSSTTVLNDKHVAANLGTVDFGSGSVTQVTPSTQTVKDKVTGLDVAPTQKDAETFYRSKVDVIGADIRVRSGANITAVSGNVSLRAAVNTQNSSIFDASNNLPSGPSDGSHLVVDSGATISAAGLRNVAVPMSRNQLSGRLFATELADSPVQRGGVLYRSDILTDARRQVTVANVTGQYNLIERTAQELSTRGGNVRLWSQGDLVVADDATIDVSGGSIKYDAGQISSSLVRRGMQLISLENAKAGDLYDALITPTTTLGTQQVPSYVQGADAGLAWVAGANFYLGADVLKADVVLGPYQRAGQVVGLYKRIGQLDDTYVTASAGLGLDQRTFPDELGVAYVLKARPDLYASLQPLGGTLTVGFESAIHDGRSRSQLVQEIDVQGTRASTAGAVPELGTPLADEYFAALVGKPVQLSAKELQAAGVSSLVLTAQTVNMAKDASLDLGASGQLAVTAANVDLDGQVRAAGGQVSLMNYSGDSIEVGPDARIDLSGTRLDERGLPTASGAVNVNGGQFFVDADQSATLAQGSVVDVSAGVWRTNGGSTSTGAAGSVSLSVNGTKDLSVEPTGQLFMDGTLSAFDFKSGGTFTVKGLHSLVLGGEAQSDLDFALDADFFSAHGFGTFNLSALGDVTVASSVTPVLQNLVLTSSRTALTPDAMTTTTKVDASVRQGVALNLAATLQPIDTQYLPAGGSVTVVQGAVVDVGAGGQIGVTAGANIEVAGALVAHGGTISLALSGDRGGANADASTDVAGFVEGQEIRLASTGVLDVSGQALTTTTSTASGDLVRGRVLGGGQVNLNVKTGVPSRGHVVTEAGSLINVSGAAADLALGKTTAKTHISQGAGGVSVASADGFALMGNLLATRPDDSVSGGQFSASISREGVADATSVQAGADRQYSPTQHQLTLLATNDDVAAHAPSANEGVLSSNQLLNAGFDRITLRADDRIVLGSGVNLVSTPKAGSAQVALRSVQLTAPVLQAADAQQHTVQAAYVSLGDRDLKPQVSAAPVLPTATAGDASLSVQAGLIEVYGHSALQGFGHTDLDVTLDTHNQLGQRQDGEVRFIGRTFTGYTDTAQHSDLNGSFSFGGDLTLQAGQIYASTLSDFTVQGLPGASSLTVLAPEQGSTSATPLSALAQLTLQARDVDIEGVIRQPFGSITINGETKPRLGDDSVLSVSGDGVTVPVGTTINARQWVYATDGTVGGVSPSTDDAVKTLDGLPVAKGILVKGAGLSIGNLSQVQAQAGGDLQAWEFIAGVGGSTDTLNRANVFAILPGYHYDFAPFDTEIMASTKAAGTSLSAGDQVQISTGSGVLAAGVYTLLPARYATLPGAVLVSATALSSLTPLSQAIARDDGSVVVSGYKTAVGSSINGGNDPRQALVLEPEATFRAKSTLQVSSINTYLADEAKRAGTALPSRPGDAGRVSLEADQAFDWSAHYNLAGATGFEAGQFDLSMPEMDLVAAGDTSAHSGTSISVQDLNATGAQSILLGGVRTGTAEDTHITTLAKQVTLNGAITVGELIAVATDTVRVSEGTSVVSTGVASTTASTITVDGMGAALMVSDHASTDFRRDLSKVPADAARTGTLTVDSGVKLQGAAIQLDGSQLVTLDSGTTLATSVLGVGAPHIALGGVSDDVNALSITGTTLNTYSHVNRLQLRSYSSIDLLGSTALGGRNDQGVASLQSLVLDTPELLGQGQASDTAQVLAQNVVLRNTSGVQASGLDQGSSKLVITAEPPLKDGVTGGITVGAGAQRLAFTSATLATAGDVVFSGSGRLNTQGDAKLSSARVTADKTANHGVNSAGLLTIEKAANSRSLDEQVGAGATLSLTGQRVVQDGLIDLPSGSLSVTGTGQAGQADTVVFTERSVTQAKGWAAKAGTDWTASAQAGQIKATALSGDVVVNGTLDVSALMPTSASDTAKSAGTIALSATQGALRLGQNAALKGSAATDTLSGTLVVDAQSVVNEPTAKADGTAVAMASAAQGTLDRLIDAARVGGLHGEVDVRVRQGDQSLNTTLKAVRASLSADTGKLTLLGQAVIDATAPQGGLVQLAAGQDVTVSAGAQIHADSSRAGANGGDVLLSSTSGLVNLEAGAAITATGDDALDGRVVISVRDDLLTALAAAHDANPDAAPVKTASIAAGEVDVVGNHVYQGQTFIDGASATSYTETVTTQSTQSVNAVTKATTKVTATDITEVVVNTYVMDPDTGEMTLRESNSTQTKGTPVVTTTATVAGAKVGTSTTTKVVSSNTDVSPVGPAIGLADISAQAEAFMGTQTSVLAALGLSDKANVRAGVEVRATGDFNVNNDLSLADALHPGGQPLFLTIRAAGSVNFHGSLSDGFSTADRTGSVNPGDGASYRLVAGADTSAANALKTDAALAGNIVIDAGKMVRTTSGSIDMAASQDIVLKTDYATGVTAPVQGVAYVAGRLADLPEGVTFATPPSVAADFTSHGGRFEATAGRDIVAPGASQLFGSWFNHTTDDGTGMATWWTTWSAFKQGFGSFGGGNIRAVAGHDIRNLGVVAPTSARVLTTTVTDDEGNITTQHSDLVVDNGGDVTVKAGRDVLGGNDFLGRGEGLIQAGGAVAVGDSLDKAKLLPMGAILGQMDGHWSLQAVSDINLAMDFNPTMYTNAVRSRGAGGLYLTYGDDSSLSMASVSGDVNWLASSRINKAPGASTYLAEMAKLGAPSEQLLTTGIGGGNALQYQGGALNFVAPIVHVAALQGNVLFDLATGATVGSLTLVASPQGDLSVYAGQNLTMKSNGLASLNLVDGPFTDSYTVSNPKRESGIGNLDDLKELGRHLTQLTGASLLHADDDTPARVYAGGDFVMDSGTTAGLITLTVSKPTEIVTGGDIRNLSFTGQNLSDTDVTRIAAGGDFIGVFNVPNAVSTLRTLGLISLRGPGELQVEAGKQLDLSTSAGIETVGNLYNPALPDQGAKIHVAAGMAKTVDLPELTNLYLAQDPAAQALLVSYVKQVLQLGDSTLVDYPQALAYYQTLTPQHQVALAEQVVNAAFVKTYLSTDSSYATVWAAQAAKAKVPVTDYGSSAFQQFKDEVVMAEIKRLGSQAIDIADSTDATENAKRQVQRQALWDQVKQAISLAGLGQGFTSSGDIELAGSKVYTQAPGSLTTGGIDLFAPGGQVVVGFSALTASDKLQAASRGLVAMQGGSIRSMSNGDFQVNSQKAFVVGEGDLMVYSANGSIDSGRGSNTDVTVPLPISKVDPDTGIVTRIVPAATTGSGIGRLNAGDTASQGSVLLAAPNGEIRALDAFIRNESGGDIAVAGVVKGGDNIKGSVTGLAPAPTVSVSLNVNSALPTDAGVSAQAAVDAAGGKKAKDPSSILTVDLLGVGDESTAPAAAPELAPAPVCPKDKKDCKR